MIDPKKELNKDELENVNGGCGSKIDDFIPKDHGAQLGKYDVENHLHEKIYLVSNDSHNTYYWGPVLASYEEERTIGTRRVHIVHVDGQHDGVEAKVGINTKFKGDDYTAFLYK